MPGLSARAATSPPESVTARLILRSRTLGSSRTSRVPSAVPPLVDILRSGSWRSAMRAAARGMAASGSGKVSPKRALKRPARSRISSRCWRWSSPTGTRVAR